MPLSNNKNTMIINLSKENINKHKYSLWMFVLLALSVYFFVIPKAVEYVEIKIVEYKISDIVDTQGEEMLNLEKEALSNEETLALQKIKDDYANKRSTISVEYAKISDEYKKELISKKTESIKYGDDDYKIGYIEKADIQTTLLKKMASVFTRSSKVVDEKIKEIEVKKNLSITSGYDVSEEPKVKNTDKAVSYEPIKYSFEIKEKERRDSLVIYDTSKLWFPIKLGVNFPSLFSYKSNGLSVSSTYYDLHKWTDLKTMPYKNIVVAFPENKKGKVVYANEDGYGKRLIIDVKDSNERYEYAHLEDIWVKVWDEIVGNQKIATTGNSWPFSKWYHLHLSVFKDGMLSSYDWWMDMDHAELVKKMYPHKDAEFIIPYLSKVPANIPQAMGIYMQLPDELKTKESFDKIMLIIDEYEKNKQFNYQEMLNHDFIKTNIKKTNAEILQWMIKFVDEMDDLRKKEMIKFIKEHSNENFTMFDQEKIASKKVSIKPQSDVVAYASDKVDFSIIDDKIWLKKFNFAFINSAFVQERRENLSLGECSSSKNATFEKYIPSQSVSDGHILDNNSIKNINKLFPIILESAKKHNMASRVNDRFWFKGDELVNDCDIAFMEVGKWYQEHSLYLDNPSSAWIFQNLSVNYYKEFPDEKGWSVLSDTQYSKQSIDSMEHSFWKLSYIKWKTFRKRDVNKDFVLKYWVWSYHWLVWEDPEKDYYVSNNLIYNGLKIVDVAAKPGAVWVKDGAFTLALKLYKLSQT